MKYHPNSFVSDSYRIQTYNLLLRSQMLYSVELRSRGAKRHCMSFEEKVEPKAGLEPATLSLRMKCSTN